MGSNDPANVKLLRNRTPVSLTTPLAYMTLLPSEKFEYAKGSAVPGSPTYENKLQLYCFDHLNTPYWHSWWKAEVAEGVDYILVGVGPDGEAFISTDSENNNNAGEYLSLRNGAAHGINYFYDPTNGTVSFGDIVFHGPGLGFEPTKFKDVI